jgi:hypothetical protein
MSEDKLVLASSINIAFIVPYRDREEHKHFFEKHMEYITEDFNSSSYIILYIHQDNNLPFNRGAMKNIGFLYIKQEYPNEYKNITLVFNDIDTLPYCKNLLDYETEKGKIKHFFGFKFALGGIFSINASDFEKIDGFPNYWRWGFEDNIIQKRAIKNKIDIDRSCFYKIGSHKILHFCDSVKKAIAQVTLEKQFNKKYEEPDGISKLQNVEFKKDDKNMVHVKKFKTLYEYQREKILEYPITNGSVIKNPKNANKNNRSLLFI